MLKPAGFWVAQSSHFMLPNLSKLYALQNTATAIPTTHALKLSFYGRALCLRCNARRRVRYEEEDEEEHGKEEAEYGHNEEIAILEFYSQSAREEALIVHAIVDDQEVEVLIFKGFSSCLSYKTSPDPSRSVLPARAVIKSIDRIKSPFDPSNIQYLEKGLTWEAFKSQHNLYHHNN